MLPEVSLNLFQYVAAGTVLAITLVLYLYRKVLNKKFFAYCYGTYIGPNLLILLDPLKRELFSVLKTLKSHNPNSNSLKILEIGVGSGINLQYYPEGTRLISVEPNSHFESYLSKNLEKFRHVQVEKFIRGNAEDMAEVEDENIDVVVSTNVLCSVEDNSAVLKEIRRVLAPGGRFLYLEHVGFPEGSWGRTIQKIVEPVWIFLNDGCRLTNETSSYIRECGFTSVEEKYVYVPKHGYLMKPHLIGMSIK